VRINDPNPPVLATHLRSSASPGQYLLPRIFIKLAW
jgi:hypothetical protein